MAVIQRELSSFGGTDAESRLLLILLFLFKNIVPTDIVEAPTDFESHLFLWFFRIDILPWPLRFNFLVRGCLFGCKQWREHIDFFGVYADLG